MDFSPFRKWSINQGWQDHRKCITFDNNNNNKTLTIIKKQANTSSTRSNSRKLLKRFKEKNVLKLGPDVNKASRDRIKKVGIKLNRGDWKIHRGRMMIEDQNKLGIDENEAKSCYINTRLNGTRHQKQLKNRYTDKLLKFNCILLDFYKTCIIKCSGYLYDKLFLENDTFFFRNCLRSFFCRN